MVSRKSATEGISPIQQMVASCSGAIITSLFGKRLGSSDNALFIFETNSIDSLMFDCRSICHYIYVYDMQSNILFYTRQYVP